MSLFEAVIGWLAPPDCLVCGLEGSALCRNCAVSGILAFGERCWRCNALSRDSKTCANCQPAGPLSHVWISTNYDGTAQALIRQYKFGHLRAAAEPIIRLMGDAISSIDRGCIVVPVPTATSRIRQRGFGHSELLAKKLAASWHLERYSALARLDQIRQLGAKRHDRLTQLAASFVVKNPHRIQGRNILLVDDVITTGGTLITAAKILKAAGASRVDALVFAKRL